MNIYIWVIVDLSAEFLLPKDGMKSKVVPVDETGIICFIFFLAPIIQAMDF